MQLPDLVTLPDLTDPTVYPTVSHGPSCTDAEPTDGRACLTAPLSRPRPYALPTEALGKIRFALSRVRELMPVSPPLGVHCPPIRIDQSPEAVGTSLVGDTAQINMSVVQEGGDACLPKILPRLVFPCTNINPSVTLTQGYPAAASWAAPVNRGRSESQCLTDLLLKLKLPGCTNLVNGSASVAMVPAGPASFVRTITDESSAANLCQIKLTDILQIPCIVPTIAAGTVSVSSSGSPGGTLTVAAVGDNCAKTFTIGLSLTGMGGGGGGSSTSGGGFVVGSTTSEFVADCCSDTGYAPGSEVPLIDQGGVLSTAGTVLDAGTNQIVNGTDEYLFDGDTVSLIKLHDQPGGRTQWKVVQA